MKLYYAPGACSMSVDIALREADVDFESETVDLRTKKTGKGEDFWAINPKGYVPTLVLDDGQVLTEVAAVLQYVADSRPGSGLAPAAGTMERTRLQEWLAYISAELHKGFGPLFNPATPDAYKTIVREALAKRFAFLDRHLAGRQFLAGDGFTVADAYAFTILSWSDHFRIDLSPWPNVKAYVDRIRNRRAVHDTLVAEGLLP